MADATGTGEKTVSEIEYNNAVERAQRFEAQLKEVEIKLKAFDGFDPRAYTALKEELNLLKADLATKSGDPKSVQEEVARREKEIREAIQKEIDKKESEITKLRGRNKELEVVDKVIAEGSSVFLTEAIEDVREVARKFCDLDENGNFIVKGDDGKPRYVNGSTTALMGPKDFVAALAETKPHWAKAQGKPGFKESGTPASSTDMKGLTKEKYLAMSPGDRAALPRDINTQMAAQVVAGK